MTEDTKHFSVHNGNAQQQWDCFEAKLYHMLDVHVPSHKAKSPKQKTLNHKETVNRG